MLRHVSALLSVVSLCSLSTHAEAQAAPPADPSAQGRVLPPVSAPSAQPPASTTPQTPTVPQQTTTTETTPPATTAPLAPPPRGTPVPPPHAPMGPPPPPPEGTLARAAGAVVDAIRIYGTLKPTVTFSSAAVESFGNPNASAVTAAANPVLANLPDDARLTFQAGQTRFGIWIGEKTKYRGHLEFDMIDFSRSSPTVQALVRLRIATVEWAPTERLVIAAGQDWDLDAPINAFGVNLVGTQFQSGNHGFMRHQVKALYTVGESLELGAAVGLQGSNATNKDGPLELARMPTLALRATGLLGKAGRLGVSALVTRLRFAPGPSERYALSAVGTVFGDLAPTDTLSIRFEGYLGRNMANTGSLGIGLGSLAKDIEEAGFFVSVRQTFLGQHAVYATYSLARALDEDEVLPSYTYPGLTAGATPSPLPALTAATSAGGTGFRWNQSARLGYDYKPTKALALAIEGFWYNTRHALLGFDEARVDAERHAFGGDAAMVYTF